jgi:type IV pilus biogenesis protein CpaD/CtpE
MRFIMRSQLAALGLILALGACEGTAVPMAKISPSFGNAVRQNAAAHTVNPEPAGAEKGDHSTNGIRAEKAIRLYRGADEKKAEQVTTK